MPNKVWFGRGIYGSKDVPIRLLDKLIALFIVIIIGMIIYFTINGGYTITFDTDGGSKISPQKLRYGELVVEPELPIKPGYQFEYWYEEEEANKSWDFSIRKVEKEQTLYAHWVPATILVKFNLNSGESINGEETLEPKKVLFNETYGELQIPVKEGAVFLGWEYSGSIIDSNTVVWMTGEHVLSALWQ